MRKPSKKEAPPAETPRTDNTDVVIAPAETPRTDSTDVAVTPAETPRADNPDVVITKADGRAAKLSPRGEGDIHYQTGRVADEAYLRIAGNDSGGRHSKEWIPLSAIRDAMSAAMMRGEPFKSTAMDGAFKGRSQNNSGFLTAALRAEGLFAADAEHKGMSRVAGDIDAWEKAMHEAMPVLKDDGHPLTMPLHPPSPETKFRPARKKNEAAQAGDATPPDAASSDGEPKPRPSMIKRLRRLPPPPPKSDGMEASRTESAPADAEPAFA